MISSKRWFASTLACCALLYCATLHCAAFPERPVRLIVSMSPGGGADTVARITAQKVAETLRVPVVVDNRPGANGSIGANAVAQATPDGYTIGWITNSHTITPSMMKLVYDPVKSFAPITQASMAPDVLVVQPSFPVQSLNDLIALARAKPRQLNFGSPGASTPSYLAMALLNRDLGLEMVHVPYKGGAEVVNALLGGEIQMYFANISTAMAQVRPGRLKPLAVSTMTRSPILPGVPTVAETLNLKNFDVSDWLGVIAPAATSREIVNKLNQVFTAAIRSPEIQERLATLGWRAVGNPPQEFSRIISADIQRWAPLLKGIDPEK